MVGSLGWRSYKFSQQFFFVKNYLLLEFEFLFEYYRVLFLKAKKKSQKKCKPPKEVALHSKRYKKYSRKREKKEK